MIFKNWAVLLSILLLATTHISIDLVYGQGQVQNAVLNKFTTSTSTGSFRTGTDSIQKSKSVAVTPIETSNTTGVEKSSKEDRKNEESTSMGANYVGFSTRADGEESPNEGWEGEGHLITNVDISPSYNGLRNNLGYIYINATLDNNVSEGSNITLKMSYPNNEFDNPTDFIPKMERQLKKEDKHVVSFVFWFRNLKPYLGTASGELTVVDKVSGKRDVINYKGPIVDINYLNIENNYPGSKKCDGNKLDKYVIDIRATTPHQFDLEIESKLINDLQYYEKKGTIEHLTWDELGNRGCNARIIPIRKF